MIGDGKNGNFTIKLKEVIVYLCFSALGFTKHLLDGDTSTVV